MAKTLLDQATELLAAQKNDWDLCGNNFAALDNVKVKTVEMPGWTVKIQFNPARIVSSGAKVDAKALKERPCFLCAHNRPAQQRGIELDGGYTLLVNPFPIFRSHFTIPTEHTDQRIAGRCGDMLRLAAGLPGYVVFYNGPKCGASAPDHMHFQSGNLDFLTLPQAIGTAHKDEVAATEGATLYACTTLPIKVFILDARDIHAGQQMFERLYRAMPVKEGETEPMMNLLAYATDDGVRLVIIPRKRHRPSFYGTEGDDSMLISPASVDLGGVIITPLEKDFEAIDADTITRLLDEVCLSADEIKQIAADV